MLFLEKMKNECFKISDFDKKTAFKKNIADHTSRYPHKK
ncbi:hypothetical protein C7391_1025 [Methanimicrococcus blatticola]|uniref:Uncharacterized protein n=1 Tax=Methanimicrococcus blatticola TaxID=91560 RepID=A0A484F4K1_9EURY|nr:hypothetical protein C7391_1025 [Methanimicrococcus blatticola]